MANEISLTVRLPHKLNEELKEVSKSVGVTKTTLIRSAIHDFLAKDGVQLDFLPNYDEKRDRLVLNINQLTLDILENACQKHNQSMNAIITAVSILSLERSSRWLQSIES